MSYATSILTQVNVFIVAGLRWRSLPVWGLGCYAVGERSSRSKVQRRRQRVEFGGWDELVGCTGWMNVQMDVRYRYSILYSR